jgi:hypothetical protein
MVQHSDERFEVAPLACLFVAPLLEEGFETLELARDRVYLNAEECKARRRPCARRQVCPITAE